MVTIHFRDIPASPLYSNVRNGHVVTTGVCVDELSWRDGSGEVRVYPVSSRKETARGHITIERNPDTLQQVADELIRIARAVRSGKDKTDGATDFDGAKRPDALRAKAAELLRLADELDDTPVADEDEIAEFVLHQIENQCWNLEDVVQRCARYALKMPWDIAQEIAERRAEVF